MSNRIFPRYDGEEQHEFIIPNGPTIAVHRKIDATEAHVAAVLASPNEEEPPHLLVLAAERVEPGFYLHSVAHMDSPGALPKLKIATVNGETRIYIRMGGPDSEELKCMTLEQFEWLIPLMDKFVAEDGEPSN